MNLSENELPTGVYILSVDKAGKGSKDQSVRSVCTIGAEGEMTFICYEIWNGKEWVGKEAKK